MTLKELRELLLKRLNKIKEPIFDCIIYGSIIKGSIKSNDIDIAIILEKTLDLKEKLSLAQLVRGDQVEFDVKVLDIKDLMDQSFIARQAILAEGYSVLSDKYFHELFGFTTFVYFDYDQSGLSASQKKMLYYALNGRREQGGLLQIHGGASVSHNLVKVPLKCSEEFKQMFSFHDVKFTSWMSVEYHI